MFPEEVEKEKKGDRRLQSNDLEIQMDFYAATEDGAGKQVLSKLINLVFERPGGPAKSEGPVIFKFEPKPKILDEPVVEGGEYYTKKPKV